jgi:hypothetical protein
MIYHSRQGWKVCGAFLVLTCAVAWCENALAVDADHIVAVRKAQQSAYAITESTNGCPTLDADFLGWPKDIVRNCEYAKYDKVLAHKRAAVVYILDVKPEAIAQWIESVCALLSDARPKCFANILDRGRGNSGYMFAISGNIIEDMDGPGIFKNWLFRNGMTTSFKRGVNGYDTELAMAEQRELAMRPNDAVLSIPSGMTRFWRTELAQMRARFPDSGAPANVNGAANRAAWLGVVQKEMLGALDGDNRLLEAWMCANAAGFFGTSCKPPN